MPAEYVASQNKSSPGTPLQAPTLRQCTMEKGLRGGAYVAYLCDHRIIPAHVLSISHHTRPIDRFSRTPTAYTRSGQLKHRAPPAPNRTSERSSRLGDQMQIIGTQPERQCHLLASFRELDSS